MKQADLLLLTEIYLSGKITGRFSTSGHTGLMVPVFAYGPGAEEFGGIDENTSFFNKFIRLLRLKQ